MSLFTQYVSGPIPEVQFADGRPRLTMNPQNPRLPVVSLLSISFPLIRRTTSRLDSARSQQHDENGKG